MSTVENENLTEQNNISPENTIISSYVSTFSKKYSNPKLLKLNLKNDYNQTVSVQSVGLYIAPIDTITIQLIKSKHSYGEMKIKSTSKNYCEDKMIYLLKPLFILSGHNVILTVKVDGNFSCLSYVVDENGHDTENSNGSSKNENEEDCQKEAVDDENNTESNDDKIIYINYKAKFIFAPKYVKNLTETDYQPTIAGFSLPYNQQSDREYNGNNSSLSYKQPKHTALRRLRKVQSDSNGYTTYLKIFAVLLMIFFSYLAWRTYYMVRQT